MFSESLYIMWGFISIIYVIIVTFACNGITGYHLWLEDLEFESTRSLKTTQHPSIYTFCRHLLWKDGTSRSCREKTTTVQARNQISYICTCMHVYFKVFEMLSFVSKNIWNGQNQNFLIIVYVQFSFTTYVTTQHSQMLYLLLSQWTLKWYLEVKSHSRARIPVTTAKRRKIIPLP